jgi:hypothetical protein
MVWTKDLGLALERTQRVPVLTRASATLYVSAATSVPTKTAAKDDAVFDKTAPALSAAAAVVRVRAGVYTSHFRYGRPKIGMFARRPTNIADKGPNATAVKTSGKNEIDVSMFRVTQTL